MLPRGEDCRDNVRVGNYVKSLTAADGSSRAVYRTRGEVATHVRLQNGPLSAILVNSSASPAAYSLHAPQKRARREPSTATPQPPKSSSPPAKRPKTQVTATSSNAERKHQQVICKRCGEQGHYRKTCIYREYRQVTTTAAAAAAAVQQQEQQEGQQEQ